MYNRTFILSNTCTFLKCVEEDFKAALKAYDDGTGVWTIGYGSTYNYDLKRRVRKGDTISLAQAEQYLKLEVLEKMTALIELMQGVELTSNQMIALLSFTYNEGLEALKMSTLLKDIKKYYPKLDMNLIKSDFMKWIYDKDGKTGKEVRSQGLINRRQKEFDLFIKPNI